MTAASSQSGQETVEYENFLKETGNTLNTSIVEDGYLIYRFQSGDSSFYVKASIEWPGGSCETDKVKIAIPVARDSPFHTAGATAMQEDTQAATAAVLADMGEVLHQEEIPLPSQARRRSLTHRRRR